jgi:hypothetical protein
MKKTILLIVIIGLLYLSSNAQETSKWTIGISAMPQFCGKIITNKSFQSPLGLNYYKNIIDQPNWGYTIGLQIKRDFTKRISLVSGLFNSDFSYCDKIRTRTIYEASHDYYYILRTEDYYYTTQYFNFNIPFVFKYKMIKKKHFFWDFGIGFSLSMFFLEKHIEHVKRSDENKWQQNAGHEIPDDPFNLFGKINTSIGYKFNKMSLNFDLDYSMAALGDRWSGYGIHYYGLGAGLSLMF